MDETITPQEGTNPELEVEVEETTTGEETEETPELEETVPKSQFQQVLARAKKAEALLRQKPTITNNPLTDEDIEAKILKSQGLNDELLNELKALSKIRGKSLIETQNDPLFIAIKEQKEAEVKSQKARLGASKGSGSVKKEKDFNSPGLSDTEHKEMWKAKIRG
jgi:hypothetical protein